MYFKMVDSRRLILRISLSDGWSQDCFFKRVRSKTVEFQKIESKKVDSISTDTSNC